MHLRRHLNQLVTVFLIALVTLCVVATGAALMARSRVQVVETRTAPLQITSSSLQRQLDRLAVELDRLVGCRSTAELAALQDSITALLDEHRQALATLAQLSDASAIETTATDTTLTTVEAAFTELKGMSANAIASEARIATTRQQTIAGLQAFIAATSALNTSLEALRLTSQKQVSAAMATSSESNNRIKRLLTIREQLAQANALVAQISATESKYKLGSFTDRTAAVIEQCTSNLTGETELGGKLTPLLQQLQAQITGDDGLLTKRKALLTLPADSPAESISEAKAAQTAVLKSLQTTLDEARTVIVAVVDDLELAVVTANRATDTAAERLFATATAGGHATELVSLARAVSSDASMLADADSEADCARHRNELVAHLDALDALLAEAVAKVPALGLDQGEAQIKALVAHSAATRAAVLADNGIAGLVAKRIAGQAKAAATQKANRERMAAVLAQFAATAKESATNQADSLATVSLTTGISSLVILVVGLGAIAVALITARRISRNILTTEATQQAQATSLRAMLDRIRGGVDELTSAASALTGSSATLGERCNTTDERAGSVAGASKVIAREVAEVTHQAEEANSRLAGISTNAAEAANTAAQAVHAAGDTRALMDRLQDSSKRIADTIGAITAIAATTNLLALNASIEAASAGAAGKGFAVVAGEVKGLSKQTAQASADIAKLVQIIRTDVSDAVQAIASFSEVVTRIQHGQSAIVDAVQIQEHEVRTMLAKLSDAAHGCGNIASAVEDVSASSSLTAHEAAGLSQIAQRLATLANDLTGLCREQT